jgi:adenylate cyclase
VLGFFLTQDRPGAAVRPKAGFAVAGSDPGASLTDYSGAILPLPRSRRRRPGSASSRSGRRGRHHPPRAAGRQGERTLVPSLSAEALRVAQGAGGLIVRSSDASGETNAGAAEMVGLKIGDAEVPVTERGEIWMHYTGPVPERTVPAWKILSGRLPPAEMERLFSGRSSWSAPAPSAFAISSRLRCRSASSESSSTPRRSSRWCWAISSSGPDWTAGLEMAVLLGAGILLALLLPSIGACRARCWRAADGGGRRRQLVRVQGEEPAGRSDRADAGLLACYVVVTLFTYVREEKQRRYIHGAFDRYLSPELVKRITDDPSRLELGGEVREMTVLFCDIRGFSHISELMGPQEIIRFLIAFLTPMTDILLARHATIDKYIGDAILAFWNAPLDDPDQHENAARAALEMIERLERLNERCRSGRTFLAGRVEIGIGLNAGPCCVGNMGSAQRLSYSLIGDTVNLASRIEGLTKAYGVRILIGEELARDLPGFATVEVDRVRVVGREKPATIHALLGDEELARSPAFAAFATSPCQAAGRLSQSPLGRGGAGARMRISPRPRRLWPASSTPATAPRSGDAARTLPAKAGTE